MSGGRPEMLIGIKDQQARNLQYLFDGGVRSDTLVPTADSDLDGHGNLPRGYLRSTQAQGAFWMTSDSGVSALFLEELEAKIMVVDEVEYEKRMDFVEEASEIVSDLLSEEWEKALERVFS